MLSAVVSLMHGRLLLLLLLLVVVVVRREHSLVGCIGPIAANRVTIVVGVVVHAREAVVLAFGIVRERVGSTTGTTTDTVRTSSTARVDVTIRATTHIVKGM